MKKSEIENQCLKESKVIEPLFYSRKQSTEAKASECRNSSALRTVKRKQKINKSISTVSFSKEPLQSEHAIAPKKIVLFRNRETRD